MRHEAIALALTGSLFLASCGALPDNKKEVSLDVLPHEAPAAVAALQDRAIYIRTKHVTGSGVLLDSNRVLTAGHVLAQPDDTDATSYACSTYSAEGLMSVTRKNGKHAIEGYASVVTRAVGQDDLPIGDDDTGMLQIYGPDGKLSRMRPTGQTPAVGSAVYFVNYQPHAGASREPYRFTDLARPVPVTYTYPAVYGGVVLGKNSAHTLGVITGLRSYGKLADTAVMPGASGGGVFTADAELLGEVTGYINADASVAELEKGYNIQIRNLPAGVRLVESNVTLTPPALLKSMKRRLAQAPACTGR